MPESKFAKTIYRWRVRFGLFALLAILALASPTWRSIFIGLAVCAPGLLIRAWASGHIRKEKTLAVSGPYQYTRNPLYLGNFVLGLSITVATHSWWCAGLFIAYFAVFYPLVILEERERMKRLFPKEYAEYTERVPLFFPRWKRMIGSSGTKFSAALYLKNKEYRALAGSLIAYGILIAKLLLLP
jgi:protein-S-isoprenylcysteine O-methyltransferase Ste14